jgi:tRNA pseudouridine55 synthase
MELLGKSEDKENTYRIKIRCGGGTYIRSLARDIAQALDTKAVMSSLLRTQSGCFYLDKALPFSLLEKDPPIEELEKYLIPTASVLPFTDLELDEKQTVKILQGQQVRVDEADGLYKLYSQDGFYGIAEVKDGLAKAKTKLC